MKWYTETIDNVVRELATDVDHGLTAEGVTNARERYGRNELPREKQSSALMLILAQINNPIIYILLIAAVLTALLADPVDSIVIFVVVIVILIVIGLP